MHLSPARKLIGEIRHYRKDIFLVGFKTTAGATEDEQFEQGLHLLKTASANLILANDLHTRTNMIVVPERSRYCVTKDRDEVLRELVDMSFLRSRLRFTRSTVLDGVPSVPWESDEVPSTLRTVVNYCISRGAYKPFLGRTEGHFAVRLSEGKFLTSIRKTDINSIRKVGMVLVEVEGEDRVIAHGHRPSVGGQSQRIVFTDHIDVDCIVHFHCPLKLGSTVPIRSQREYECGSHECGKNTSSGMSQFGNLWAVMLDKHGPNIAFSRNIDPNEVIRFIEDNFNLSGITDGSSRSFPEIGPAQAYTGP